MTGSFFIVGPTAAGKSEIAAEIAHRFDAEIVSADAFQVYRGLDLLTAKPDLSMLAKAPHHLLGVVPLSEEMNAEKFRAAAVEAIREIHSRGKHVIVAGGSGLYVKALTHGLSKLPGADWELREKLGQRTPEELYAQLCELDPQTAERIDRKNKRRLIRAIEVCFLSGNSFSVATAPGTGVRAGDSTGILPVGRTGIPPVVPFASGKMPVLRVAAPGVFVFRERAELYERIDRRVEQMFAAGVVEEVRAARNLGSTAGNALGLREIRAVLAGEFSEPECVAKIQQATRRYAKRQLTWFQHQHNFEPLNLSSHGHTTAIELIAQNARVAFAQMDV